MRSSRFSVIRTSALSITIEVPQDIQDTSIIPGGLLVSFRSIPKVLYAVCTVTERTMHGLGVTLVQDLADTHGVATGDVGLEAYNPAWPFNASLSLAGSLGILDTLRVLSDEDVEIFKREVGPGQFTIPNHPIIPYEPRDTGEQEIWAGHYHPKRRRRGMKDPHGSQGRRKR